MTKIDLSLSTVLKFFAVLIAIILLYFIRDILVMLFVVIIVVAALDPLVDWGERYKIPRGVSALFIYLVLISLLSLLIYLILPPLIEEIRALALNLPSYIAKITPLYHQLTSSLYDWQRILQTLSQQMGKISGGIYSAGLAIFGGLASALTILVLSFYLLLENRSVKEFVLSLVPTTYKERIIAIGQKIGAKIGGWLRGQVVLSLTVGLLNFIGLLIIGVPFALTLGVLAAVLEIIPIIGPVLSGLIAIVVAFATVGWLKALLVLALYVLVQQLESNLLVPKIMGKAVGLSPVVIIIALLIGAKLAGLMGAILAIPAAAGIAVLIQEWSRLRK